VGGTTTTIQEIPWQVAVETNDNYFCGGVILDPSHVLTAAHCVLTDRPGSPLYAPGALTVISGTTHIYDNSLDPTAVQSSVAKDIADPMYDGSNYDAAVITLSAPLSFDGYRAAIPLATTSPPTGTTLSVSGWGTTSENGTLSNTLMRASVEVSDFTQCQASYAAQQTDLLAGEVICAGAQLPPRDSCQGDSGGPLFNLHNELVGIVSSGIGCAEAAYPGIYTSMTSPSVRQFINGQLGSVALPPGPSLSGVAPSITGNAVAGQTLQCSPGAWSGNPTFSYAFKAGDTTLQAAGGSNSYLLTSADVGRTIICQVHASNPNGAADASSAPVGPVTAPAVVVQQPVVTQPTVIAQPRDTTAPSTTVTSAKCTRTRCAIHVTATDSGISSGVAGLRVLVRNTTSKPCVVRHHRRTCTHTSTQLLKATPYVGGRFVIIASNLPSGKHRFTITAVDTAGNVQATPTTRTITTKK
jgi:trypsin